jgi:hypothetical protein
LSGTTSNYFVFLIQISNSTITSRHCEPTGRANARPMTGSAKQSIKPRKERMDCLAACASRNNTTRHAPAISRHDLPESCINPLPNRGRRECRAHQCARSLACEIKKHTSIVTTVTPETPGIPRAMVLTVSFVISSVTGLSCHRRRRDAQASSPT